MPETQVADPRPPKTYEEAQALLGQIVTQEVYRRARLYAKIRPDIDTGDPPELKQALLFQTLNRWASSPLEFIKDIGWAHDTKGRFGAGHIPKNAGAPPGMVPIIPYPIQTKIIGTWEEMMNAPEEDALVVEKSRQVALTTLLGGWLPLHQWLFRENGKGILTTYDKDLVDSGGKGQRTEDTLFGALRAFLDAIVTCVPQLRFNPNAKAKKTEDGMSQSGLMGAQDVSMKLTRPPWIVCGQRLFPEAEGNYLRGDIPGDSLARGSKPKFVLMDEIGQYNEKEGGRDKLAWASSQAAAKLRFAWGTLPKQGGTASFFYQLVHSEEFAAVARQTSIHWSDIYPYMAGASWICRACNHRNQHPPSPGPGRNGTDHVCGFCDLPQRVVYKDMTSPWFEKMCALALGDKVQIAREYQLDWMASQGDILFSSLDGRRLVRPHQDGPSMVTLEGFDPGQTMRNSGAWICGRFDPARQTIGIVGYWMSINPHPEYWVPFMKHWSAERTRRMPVIYGKFANRGTFGDIFDYDEDAYRMMDLVSRYPLGELRGDKYGSHQTGGTSIYESLADWRIFVQWLYTKDREDLVRRGIEWSTRMYIDTNLDRIKPPTPLGGRFPAISDAFLTAKPKEDAGEGRRSLDVSKKDPPHVHNAADAWFYLVSQLQQVHAKALVSGGFAEDSEYGLRDGGIDDFSW